MNRGSKIILEPIAVAIYDVDEKKLVALFRNANVCSRYCFKKTNTAIMEYVHKKTKNKSNLFARTICFRSANAEQKKLLGDKEFLILDSHFDRTDIETTYSEFYLDKKRFTDIQRGNTKKSELND